MSPEEQGLIHLTLVVALAGVPEARAACPASVEDLEAGAARALDAQRAGDAEALASEIASLDEAIRCVDAAIPAETAARLHLAHTVSAWVLHQDLPEALLAAQGVWALEPEHQADPTLAPEGSEIALVLRQAQGMLSGTTWSALPDPGEAVWLIDGERGVEQAPTSRYALLQREGASLETWYLRGDLPTEIFKPRVEPLAAAPAAPPAPAPTVADGPSPLEAAPLPSPGRGLAILSGASGALALGSLGVAAMTRARFNDYDAAAPPLDAGDDLYQLNRAAGLGGYTLGAVSVGLGAAAVWSRR